MVCTFFGHRDCCNLDSDRLREEIERLIHQGVDRFYVGNHGGFDRMVRSCLKQLQGQYPQIHYCVVQAYLPTEEASDTIYPEGMELGHPRFAIVRRNKWMIGQSNYCLCYVNHTWGGAYKFAQMAKRCGLRIINLGRENLD